MKIEKFLNNKVWYDFKPGIIKWSYVGFDLKWKSSCGTSESNLISLFINGCRCFEIINNVSIFEDIRY